MVLDDLYNLEPWGSLLSNANAKTIFCESGRFAPRHPATSEKTLVSSAPTTLPVTQCRRQGPKSLCKCTILRRRHVWEHSRVRCQSQRWHYSIRLDYDWAQPDLTLKHSISTKVSSFSSLMYHGTDAHIARYVPQVSAVTQALNVCRAARTRRPRIMSCH